MRNFVLWGFWPCLTFSQPRVDYGHFGHFGRKRHFERSGVQTSCATPLYMFLWSHGEKVIFLGFSGSGTQIGGRQNTISTVWNKARVHKCLILWRFEVGENQIHSNYVMGTITFEVHPITLTSLRNTLVTILKTFWFFLLLFFLCIFFF